MFCILLYAAIIALSLSFLLTLFLNRHPSSLPLPPGPKPWPIVGNLPHLGTKPHHSLAAMARTYGPLLHLRLGSVNMVVAASAEVAAQFLKTHDVNFANRPPNSGAKHMAYNYQDMVFAPYGPRWRMLRKICSTHLFSAKALKDCSHVRQEEVAILVRELAGAGKMAVNLGQLLNVCSTNALGRVMLGKRVFNYGNVVDVDPKAAEFKEMVVELMTIAGLFNIGDFIPILDFLDLQGIVKRMKNIHARFDTFFNQILEDHKINGRNGSKNVDMLSILMSLKDVDDENGKLSDTEIKALLLNLFAAGTDTSSSTIEWAIAEIICNPKIMAKAQKELDSVIGHDRLVTESDLSQLPYIEAIVKESFRLHPSTPLSLPRMASESCEINGYYIPKGSTLLVNIWAIGRDPNTWADPLVFKPERFLLGGEKPNVEARGNHFELIPFGAGRRICAGMSLGIRMVQLLTATFIHAFNWELPEGEAVENLNMDETFGLALQRAVTLMVRPSPRLAPKVYWT